MLEKIKVSIPERIYERLCRDAREFLILKPSGKENLNALINRIVVNFYEEFSLDDATLRENVLGALSTIPEKYAKEAFPAIINAIARREEEETIGRKVAISFKPTKATEAVFVHIENVLLREESLSSFYRRLFIAYAKKGKSDREKIVHREVAAVLKEAMEKGLQVCISLVNDHIYNGSSLYAIEPAKDEFFNYVLLYSGGKNRTLRLAKIKTATLLPNPSEIPEPSRVLFERQVVCGAQYPIYETYNEPIRVELTEKGKGLFEKIYLYRPIPIAIEGNVYTFDCSPQQVIYYFERFGAEALILSPKKHGIFMRNYYYYALKKYRTIYGKD